MKPTCKIAKRTYANREEYAKAIRGHLGYLSEEAIDFMWDKQRGRTPVMQLKKELAELNVRHPELTKPAKPATPATPAMPATGPWHPSVLHDTAWYAARLAEIRAGLAKLKTAKPWQM